MKPLVIIKSCHKHAERRAAVRRTWLKDLVWDRIFILGKPPAVHQAPIEENTIEFPVSDAFPNIAPKLQAGLKWGLEHGYNNFFVCDDDTYLRPERLAVPEGKDYVGFFRSNGGHGYELPYIQGSCFYLSQMAASFVADSIMMADAVPDDVAIGRALYGKVIFNHDPRFYPGPFWPAGCPENGNDFISTHKCCGADMDAAHKHWLRSNQ